MDDVNGLDQARCSAGTLVTLPYAGQEWELPQELSNTLVVTTAARIRSTFFIVRSFVFRGGLSSRTLPKVSPCNGRPRKKFQQPAKSTCELK
jgi:hypothetical protein